MIVAVTTVANSIAQIMKKQYFQLTQAPSHLTRTLTSFHRLNYQLQFLKNVRVGDLEQPVTQDYAHTTWPTVKGPYFF